MRAPLNCAANPWNKTDRSAAESVFDEVELKKKVFAEAEPYFSDDAVVATNTSALPLEMVSAISRSKNFVGLHSFNPVDKMRRLGVIVGDSASDETLARALDSRG